jgi:Galactose oxidase, central domain
VAPGSGKQWQEFPSLPDGRAGASMVYNPDLNALIFAGGAERPVTGKPHAVNFAHTWMYEFDNPGWQVMADIPFLSNHMSYVSTEDASGKPRHYFVGGQIGENEFTGNVADNYEWDAIGEKWIKRQAMPFARGHASSSTTAVPCGYIIAGGSTNGFRKTMDISHYDIASNSWTKIGELPVALNTPVCAIDFVAGMYYCETGLYV